MTHRSHLADEFLEDGVAAGVALGAEVLEDLLRGVGCCFGERAERAKWPARALLARDSGGFVLGAVGRTASRLPGWERRAACTMNRVAAAGRVSTGVEAGG